MFGRTVKVDDIEYFVLCTPQTPTHEVLQRAANMAAKELEARLEAEPIRQAYQRALR